MTPRILFALVEAWRDGQGMGADRAISNWANDVQWYADYADKRHALHGVVSANWNDLDRYDRETRTRVNVSDVPSRVCRLLERFGVDIEWCDQVTSCSDCGNCIQTEPDCYSWTPEYVVGDGEILCTECIDYPDNAERS